MFYGTVLHIIVTYIKENKSDFRGCCLTNTERQITKLQKLHSPPRNLTAGNKLPVSFFLENLFAWAIYRPRTKYLLKDLIV